MNLKKTNATSCITIRRHMPQNFTKNKIQVILIILPPLCYNNPIRIRFYSLKEDIKNAANCL